ncbi:MAG: ATP-binding protein [Chloroflexi bacterium]|nr:ATP-binding protein [Chloroflexota bacterium]
MSESSFSRGDPTAGNNVVMGIHAALRHSTVTVFTQDTGLRYTCIFNPIGCTPDQVIGKTDMELFPPDEATQIIEIKRLVMESGSGIRAEVQLTINQQPYMFDFTAEPLRDAAGQVTGIAGSTVDITERKRAERELEIERAQLQTILNQMPAGIIIAEASSGSILLSNAQLERMQRGTLQSISAIGEHGSLDIRHPDGQPYTQDELPLMRALRNGEVITGEEMDMQWPNGPHVIVSANAGPIRNARGEIIAAVVMLNDITERKMTEQELRRALDRSQDLYATSRRVGTVRTPQSVLSTLLANSYFATSATRATISIFEHPWTREDPPPNWFEVYADWNRDGQGRSFVDQRYPVETAMLAEMMDGYHTVMIRDTHAIGLDSTPARHALRALGTAGLLLLPLVAAGEWYGILNVHFQHPIDFSAEDLHHIQGLADQVAGAIYNLRLLEAEAKARQAAEHANELRLRFLAMISHELRTPLTSIKGFATTLLADDVTWDPASQRDFLQIIDLEADKLTEMIEQLLDLSRIESGTLSIRPEPLALDQVLGDASAQLRLLAPQHSLAVETSGALPLARADRQRVIQVLANLVSNAAKYAPPDTAITVTARPVDGGVQVDVVDQGPGIPAKDRTSVFEPFRRGSDERTRWIRGAGLGLAICKGLVEAHGGRIWIQERTELGTTVSFTLPGAQEVPSAEC